MASSANIGAHRLEIDVGDAVAPAGDTSRRPSAGPPPPRAAASSRSSRRFAKLNVPPSAMLRLRPCRRSTARLRLPAPRRWPSRCASIRRGSRLIWRARCRASPGRSTVRQFKGGQSNPTYLLETPARKYVLRRKPPGKLLPSAHAVDREFRVIAALHAQGFPVARAGALLRRRERHRHGVLCDGLRRGPRVLESGDAGLEPGRARGDLRRDERDAGAAAFATSRRRSGLPTSAAARTTSRARSTAGRSSTAPRETEKIDEMERLIEWLPAHHPAGRPGAARARRLPARQHDPATRASRRCSRCSTGSCPRSAIRSPTSPIT